VARRVVFSPEAQGDLLQLYGYIADRSGIDRAPAYTERIVEHCRGFATVAERGTRRDDLRPGLRVTGFERRVSVAFHVGRDTVTAVRILYGGRDVDAALREDDA
jgi:toxin ParE1/3/4